MFFCLFLTFSQSFAADMIDFVPDDSFVILHLNIKQIIGIPEIKEQLLNIINSQGKKELLSQFKDTGFNPLSDVDTVLVPVPANIKDNHPQDPYKSDVTFIVNGKFNHIDKAIETIKGNKDLSTQFTLAEEDGFKTITANSEGKGQIKLLFIDNNTILIGTETGVNKLKAVKLGKIANIKSKKDFAAIVSNLNTKATIAAAFDLPDEVKQFFAGNEKSKPLSNIDFLSLDLTKTTDVAINVIGSFNGSANMKEVENSINSFFSSVKPEELPYDVFTDFFKNSKLSFNGSSAIITTTISKASIDKLIENFGRPETNNK